MTYCADGICFGGQYLFHFRNRHLAHANVNVSSYTYYRNGKLVRVNPYTRDQDLVGQQSAMNASTNRYRNRLNSMSKPKSNPTPSPEKGRFASQMYQLQTQKKQAIQRRDMSFYSRGGSVDLNRRPVIPSDWLVDMGYDAERGGTATVFTHAVTVGNNGNTAVLLTPILKNGDVLERNTLEEVMDNVSIGNDGKPYLPGGREEWGFDLADILISSFDVSSIPKEQRSNYINQYANDLHEVQENLYSGVKPISEPTDNIQPIQTSQTLKSSVFNGKDFVRNAIKQVKKVPQIVGTALRTVMNFIKQLFSR